MIWRKEKVWMHDGSRAYIIMRASTKTKRKFEAKRREENWSKIHKRRERFRKTIEGRSSSGQAKIQRMKFIPYTTKPGRKGRPSKSNTRSEQTIQTLSPYYNLEYPPGFDVNKIFDQMPSDDEDLTVDDERIIKPLDTFMHEWVENWKIPWVA